MPNDERSQVSIRVPTTMLTDLEQIAAGLERDRTWVMLRAFQLFLEGEGAILLQEAKGCADLDDGRGVDFDEVMDRADEIVTEARAAFRRKAG